MIDKKLSRLAPGWLAPGRRVYAIGDVHGCARRMASLHRLVEADLRRDPVASPMLIHLGDYIDRGPDSAGAVRMLARGPVSPGLPAVSLRGNHEQMMLDAFTGDPEAVRNWLDNNAEPTLRSWGVSADRTIDAWIAAIPAQDWAWLSTLPLLHRLDGYVFVHAGLRPGIALDAQDKNDLLWIREPFLGCTGPYLPDQPAIAVVHGHTPEAHPIVTERRVGIDTGAVAGGALTCAVLERRTIRFLAA